MVTFQNQLLTMWLSLDYNGGLRGGDDQFVPTAFGFTEHACRPDLPTIIRLPESAYNGLPQ